MLSRAASSCTFCLVRSLCTRSVSRNTNSVALCWTAATYLPFFALAATGRVMYIFYFLPTVPAAAIAIALLAERLPLAARWAYLTLYLFGFVSLFPFRVLP